MSDDKCLDCGCDLSAAHSFLSRHDRWEDCVRLLRATLNSDVTRAHAVVEAAKALRDSGYDGPFMGDAVAPLLAALAAYEREGCR